MHPEKESKKPFIFAVLAVILLLPSVLGLIASLGLITQTINTIQAIKLYGTGDPRLMAGAISQELVSQFLTLLLLLPGIIIAFFVKYKYKYTERWYRNCLRVFALCLLLLLPLGTLLGLVILFLTKKASQIVS